MAVAAFKSTSRRGAAAATASASSDRESRHQNHQTPARKAPPRRSRSVSAAPRSHLYETTASAELDFLIKRDNPLYCSSNSVSPPDKDKESNETEGKRTFQIAPTMPITPSEDARRGRSVSRNNDSVKNGSGIGRSLSRVDTGRRHRSVSRGPGSRTHVVNSESDADQESGLLTKYRNRNEGNKVSNVGRRIDLVRGGSDANKQIRSFRGKSDGLAANLPSSPTCNWEDGVLGNSVSEAEERTIKAVCEQMKPFQGDNVAGDASSRIYETVRSEVRRAIADIQSDLESAIRRSNASAIATANVTDIPPDLVNPGAVELVLDIRREYANKLEQSHERARKLRADLAVEEHRGLELSRILKEVLPDPKTLNGQKPRTGRKSSIERRKISKRLTDEAMAYFDECVSLSTFDSSDFSSPEDPPIKLVGFDAPVDDSASFSRASCSAAAYDSPNIFPVSKQEPSSMCSHNESELSTTGSSKRPNLDDQMSLNGMDMQWGRKSQFSFGRKPDDASDFHQDIRQYVKHFEKENGKTDTILPTLKRNHYDPDEYNLQSSPQSLLLDMMLQRNRIESGSMLLCGVGIANPMSPFVSLF
ncbi:hypothetical protein Tsubulata_026786 [Turnera subulata]|uniref:Uncharacterized protein n=1 Tax=Turnera subulata TaxID=218843 RepID=A0A9Q0GCV0_9ROSI|nr:hypothetical protein Tsubulata_026786 [Turnera subulata]